MYAAAEEPQARFGHSLLVLQRDEQFLDTRGLESCRMNWNDSIYRLVHHKVVCDLCRSFEADMHAHLYEDGITQRANNHVRNRAHHRRGHGGSATLSSAEKRGREK